MLVRLAQKPKAIAWFFMTLIYAELLLTPVIAKANMPPLFFAFNRNSVTNVYSGPISEKELNPVSHASDAGVNSRITTGEAPTKMSAPDNGGPTQPEMTAFSSVSSGNMVDLFSGDFSYTIPLLDVGGYPVTLGYNAGISMDQEASWVGLGWNLNPGAVTRNLRGLPDDFNGDVVKKTVSVKDNKTVGVTVGAGIEVVGFPSESKPNSSDTGTVRKPKVTGTASLQILHNNYKGWGAELGISTGIGAGGFGKGGLSSGLSVTTSSMNGLTVTPSLSMNFSQELKRKESEDKSFFGAGANISLPYNSRSGLGHLQLSTGISMTKETQEGQITYRQSGSVNLTSTQISFYTPAALPTISIPYTSNQYSFTAKLGVAKKGVTNSGFITGYVAKQYVQPADTSIYLSSYGYLNYQNAAANGNSLLDFNREKELPFREKPAYPHIAVPSYTYDAFSITGEGTGGMFRPYRTEIGYIHDHVMRNYSESGRFALDLGVGDLAHFGIDIGPTTSVTRTGPWLGDNVLKDSVRFRQSNGLFEAVYFKNPSGKSINPKQYYQRIGGDDLVTVELDQRNPRDPSIVAAASLLRYRNGLATGKAKLDTLNTEKRPRDKRTQVITYLTAKEADAVGLNKYIENYTYNVFDPSICGAPAPSPEGFGEGLKMELFGNRDLGGPPAVTRASDDLWVPLTNGYPKDIDKVHDNNWSIKWTGRFRAPVTGRYEFRSKSDDGFFLKVRDIPVIENWKINNFDAGFTYGWLNLEAGEFYELEAGMFDSKKYGGVELWWKHPNADWEKIPMELLYPAAVDSFRVKDPVNENKDLMVKEKRQNDFRKPHHISEISVLNDDGRRYVYGIPVYNLLQKDLNFSVDPRNNKADLNRGMVKIDKEDITTGNMKGKDRYISREEMPAYAHSFLLSGILSDDYSDLTGNGITEDDLGNAVKFNYSKISGYRNPFKWRTPAGKDSASYIEGLRTDYRDDKGSFVYGEKEMWYLHSIESKTMIATFFLSARKDMPSVTEMGERVYDNVAKRLDSIKLFSKTDFAKYGVKAKAVKTVHFRYSYELCRGYSQQDSGKLTLKKIWFTYNGIKRDSAKSNPYQFRYHDNNPRYNNQHSDRWGSYKDPAQNPTSVAGDPVRNAEYPYALQDSTQAAYNAGAWNMDGIELPSGGTLKIEYESDDYGYVQNRLAMQMYQIAAFGNNENFSSASSRLYDLKDNLYVFIKVPSTTGTVKDIYNKYLAGIDKLYFNTLVGTPTDENNNGQSTEYVKGYALLQKGAGGYGIAAPGVLWVKMEGLHLNGETGGTYSPIAIAALQFLKLNLPSKAFPGSETGDNFDLGEAVKILASWVGNITEALNGFERIARSNGKMQPVVVRKSFVRLLNPQRKKYGGGHRVKRVTLFDNWNKMTGQKTAKYGQEYIYTTTEDIAQVKTSISSGVASYEPAIGGEENPFRLPIEYIDQPSVLLPSTLGYTEEPLGESFFPAAGVGYSRVRVRTINFLKKKSANGYDETCFYTAKDYPVFTERTLFDATTFKRYKPAIGNVLKFAAYHYLTLSQGFKVELNDMHGKLRSQASYPEADSAGYLSYAEYFYRTENTAGGKRLKNTVMAIMPDGSIDTAAMMGKTVELMMDLREQESIVEAFNFQPNSELFMIGAIPAILALGWNFFQYEKNRFRSVATVKLIQRSGILDSVITYDKGRRLSTSDLLYDSESGDVLMTRTQNAWMDYIYNFTYPSHWAYKGMGPAFRNVGATANGVTIRDGKITVGGLNALDLFSGGDEILVAGKQRTGGNTCAEDIASFPNYSRIWCVDSSDLYGGARSLYFIDRKGKPYTGFDISMKVIRSGSRNIFAGVGSVTSTDSLFRKNPVTKNYELRINDTAKVLAASSNEFKQFWKVQDLFAQKESINCIPNWLPTGKFRCEKINGINTGKREALIADSNRNSNSYGQTQWYDLGMNCDSCPKPAKWIKTAQYWCESTMGATPPPLYGPLVTAQAATGGPGNPGPVTGYIYYVWKDTAQCSSSYDSLKWVKEPVLDCVTCAGGTSCGGGCTNCTGPMRKCINGICENPVMDCQSVYTSHYPQPWLITITWKFSDNTDAQPPLIYYSDYSCNDTVWNFAARSAASAKPTNKTVNLSATKEKNNSPANEFNAVQAVDPSSKKSRKPQSLKNNQQQESNEK